MNECSIIFFYAGEIFQIASCENKFNLEEVLVLKFIIKEFVEVKAFLKSEILVSNKEELIY